MFSANRFVDNTQYKLNNNAADLVRELACQGLLTQRIATVSGAAYTRLSGGAYDIAWPIVFERLTRRLECRRGHPRCAISVNHLEPECFDRFQDDVEAVLADLFRNAKVPIRNLEGWLTNRLVGATVDGYRRRRGQRGALQRPRLPKWLAAALGHDPWLTTLAVEMLIWVGIPATAGASIWPWGAWAERRAVFTGDRRGAAAEVAKDVDTVLAAMRRNQAWYENFVERPLGRKQAPPLSADGTDPDRMRERPHLALTRRDESDDARLLELAALAVTAIEAHLVRGDDPRAAVVNVLQTVFGSGNGAEHMDWVPGGGPAEDEWVAALLADRESIDRIVSEVLDIVAAQ